MRDILYFFTFFFIYFFLGILLPFYFFTFLPFTLPVQLYGCLLAILSTYRWQKGFQLA